MSSFEKLLGGALFTPYVDNDRVTAACIKVSSDSPAVNLMAAILWFLVSKEHLHPMFHRVESEANIADGPTRPDDVGCSLLRELGAAELPAYLPGRLVDLWHALCQ